MFFLFFSPALIHSIYRSHVHRAHPHALFIREDLLRINKRKNRCCVLCTQSWLFPNVSRAIFEGHVSALSKLIYSSKSQDVRALQKSTPTFFPSFPPHLSWKSITKVTTLWASPYLKAEFRQIVSHFETFEKGIVSSKKSHINFRTTFY